MLQSKYIFINIILFIYYSRIQQAALISINDYVIVYGGFESGNDLSTVAEYKNEKWTKLGQMNQARSGHNCILFGSEILIVGGTGSK